MRSLVNTLALGALVALPVAAQEFACGSRYCAIPYDAEGVQNGVEVCWNSPEKTEKVRELTWSKGLRSGEARCWEKGKLVTQAHFKDNLLSGLFVDQRFSQIEVHRFDQGKISGYRLHLDKDGKNFRLGPCYRDGVADEGADGFCRRLDYGTYQTQVAAQLAKLKATESARLAKLNGAQLEKYSDGKLKAKYTTRDGEITGDYESFWPSGAPRVKGSYDRGRRQGEFLSYNEAGMLTARDTYQQDKPVKLETILQNGKLSERLTWVTQEGRERVCRESFHENGNLAARSCRRGVNWYSKYDGEYVWFNELGRPVLKGQYLDDQRVGVWSTYDYETLVLIGESVYEKGKLVSEWYVSEELGRVDRSFFPDGSLKSETMSKLAPKKL